MAGLTGQNTYDILAEAMDNRFEKPVIAQTQSATSPHFTIDKDVSHFTAKGDTAGTYDVKLPDISTATHKVLFVKGGREDSTYNWQLKDGTILSSTDLGNSIVLYRTSAEWKIFNKEFKNTQINIKALGAKEDGSDTASIIESALALTHNILIDGEYYVSRNIDLEDDNVQGTKRAKLYLTSSHDIFTVKNKSNTVGDVTNLENNELRVSNEFTQEIKATVADATSLKVGDNIRITGINMQSLFKSIKRISGNDIYMEGVLDFTITNPKMYLEKENNSTIQGITFEARINMDSQNYMCEIYGTKAEVLDCMFQGKSSTAKVRAVSIALSSGAKVLRNKIRVASMAIQIFDSDNNTVEDNQISQTIIGIVCKRGNYNSIHKNKIKDGTSKEHGIGIEITTEKNTATLIFDKCAYNKIIDNETINVNKGRPDSGIGGIHLNFRSAHNIVMGNTSMYNSFGIYLENNSTDNIIMANHCNNNNGYYGVGIELDYDCHRNLISTNHCNNNNGSSDAGESCGIQIRNWNEHSNDDNTIISNVCHNNGITGIKVYGNRSIVALNNIKNNGVVVETCGRTCYGIEVAGANNFIYGNIIKQEVYDSRASNLFNQIALGIKDSTDLDVFDNKIKTSYFTSSAIKITGKSESVRIIKNNIKSKCAESRHIHLAGASEQHLKNIVVKENDIDGTINGKAVIETYYVDSFSVHENNLITNTIIHTYNSTDNILGAKKFLNPTTSIWAKSRKIAIGSNTNKTFSYAKIIKDGEYDGEEIYIYNYAPVAGKTIKLSDEAATAGTGLHFKGATSKSLPPYEGVSLLWISGHGWVEK